MGWEVHPDGLLAVLRRVHREYGPKKLFVTENGAAYAAAPDADGRVRDVERVRFLRRHFEAAHQALAEGVPLAGFYVWSLLDNFEWAHGHSQRFGIVWVDFATQERTVKDSARFLRAVIRHHGLVDDARAAEPAAEVLS
jgi:beta-glucosidase